MTLGRQDYHSQQQTLYDDCKRNLYHHVNLTMTDGSFFDGIIENVDPDRITVLVGEDVMERESENESESDQRQYYGYGHRPRRRFRRFRRRTFPLATLGALALLPYIDPYLYQYPYQYPYY
ncbi:hypothetical protein RJD24_14535 [Bacillaceae bacterium IKA-2]|nr:hypothetical protein RJD24_14535 [Bacillaceae bacterium IKA-2]